MLRLGLLRSGCGLIQPLGKGWSWWGLWMLLTRCAVVLECACGLGGWRGGAEVCLIPGCEQRLQATDKSTIIPAPSWLLQANTRVLLYGSMLTV